MQLNPQPLKGAAGKGAAPQLPELVFCPDFVAQGSGCLSLSEKQTAFIT